MNNDYLRYTASSDSIDLKLALKNKSAVFFIIKRLFDIFASVTGLVILFPVFLITGIAIFIEDGRPIFFSQERDGLDGSIFRMYKFRSMCKNASAIHKTMLDKNEQDGPAFKMKNDPRVTRVGKFIRRASIDELPQLINVIKGEMSIVGPRPLPTYETALLNDYQRQRLLVKPGLTSYWQCCGRNEVTFDRWMELDMKYIREASIITDIKIILKTIMVVIHAGGAY